MRIRVREAALSDACALALRLRREDLNEIQARRQEKPQAVLEHGILCSYPCFAVVETGGAVLAVFGVTPEPDREGSGFVWLLGSDALTKYGVLFARRSAEWIDVLHARYARLWNYVDARNTVHIRWLLWCGFHMSRRIERFGIEERPFFLFERLRAPQSAEDAQRADPLHSEEDAQKTEALSYEERG